MKRKTKKSWSVSVLLKGILAGVLLFSSAAQAQLSANCADGTDSNCIAQDIEGGLWNANGLGQCLFVLPTPEKRGPIEEWVGPEVFPGADTPANPVCVGGLNIPNLTTTPGDVTVRVLRGEGAQEEGALAFSYPSSYPAGAGSAQFIPESCGVTDLDSTNPDRRNGTFDNGDNDIAEIEPMSAELTLGANVSGDATVSYYFMNGARECRHLDWSLTINGTEVKFGEIWDFRDGKYLVFDLEGLQGREVIRLDVVNPFAEPDIRDGRLNSCPNPDSQNIPGVNSVISGVFVDGTSVCAPPAEPASLGDRVWEDVNRNGIQNCRDTNGNGIIGDTLMVNGEMVSDEGQDCRTGVPNVPVTLLEDCSTPIRTVDTDDDGFYLFENLAPGDYCVDFELPDEDFCDTRGFDLGKPVFTVQDANANRNEGRDSDADPTSGVTDSINLVAGENERRVDAGIFCPAKIGDFVFEDTNKDGVQNPGEPGVPGVKTTLFECGPDMIAGTDDDVETGEMRDTDGTGMYMYGAERIVNGDLQDYDLPPGKYYVQFDDTTLPPGFGFTTPKVGANDKVDSDCLPLEEGRTACTNLTRSRAINLNRDCGIVPPPPPTCDLLLDKTCRVEAPPPQDFDKCDGKLQEFTVVWNGGSEIQNVKLGTNIIADTVSQGQELTVSGPFNDNDVEITFDGGQYGQSVFHTSCSDSEFNSPDDCGKAAGDGKDSKDGFDNLWSLAGFVDKEGRVLDCDGGPDGEFEQNCDFELPPLPSCDNGDKPDTLTWRYDGGTGGEGDCEKSTFLTIVNEDGKMHEDFECSGSVNLSLPITVTDDDGTMYYDVAADGTGTFTTPRDAIKKLTLTDTSGGKQILAFHESCSQPLEAQATAGALTLVGLGGRTGGQDVTYRYTVTNLGDPLSNVKVVDSVFGNVGMLPSLGSGNSDSFEVMTALFGTTTNKAYASGMLPGGAVCAPMTASDSVTVTVVEPTCNVSIELYKVEDDKIKWKLSNSSGVDATIENLELSWPGSTKLEKIKFDGNDILKDVRLSSPVDISDWMKEVKDRTLKAGDTEKIEFEFTDKFPMKDDQPASDFDLKVTFEEGCSVTF